MKKQLFEIVLFVFLNIMPFVIKSQTVQNELDYDSMINTIIKKVGDYNNLHEIPSRIPSLYLNKFDKKDFGDWIIKGFQENKPLENLAVRKNLFYALDILTVITEDDNFIPLFDFWRNATQEVLNILKEDVPNDHIQIVKLYNEGLIVRDSTAGTIGIDIVFLPDDDSLGLIIAEELDLLIITHEDWDHYQPQGSLITEMKKQGKPVLIINNQTWEPIGKLLDEGETNGIRWWTFKGGHINLRFSGFVKFEIDGMSFIHSGDNTTWLDFGKTNFAKDIDVFFFKPESIFIENRSRKGGIQDALVESLELLDPKLIIPHHALELGHGLGAYGHDMYFRLKNQVPNDTELLFLQWGEMILIPK